MRISEKLKERRVAEGKTRLEVAKELGVTAEYVRAVENGKLDAVYQIIQEIDFYLFGEY